MSAINPHGPGEIQEIEPYRAFFPLGLLFGLLGVGIWGIYDLGWIESVPSWWHIDLQLHGFLFAFVMGFLFTAVPRFAGAPRMFPKELSIYLIIFFTGNCLTAFMHLEAGRVFFMGTVLMTLIFVLRRFFRRSQNPPTEFVFVALGLLTGFVASVFRVLPVFFEDFAGLEIVGRRLLTEGMMVLIVLGVGGKLFPLFFGLLQGGSQPIQIGAPKTWTQKHTLYLGMGLLYLATFLLEHLYSQSLAFWFRALMGTLIFLYAGQLYRWPKEKGFLVKFLFFSAWAVLLSLWGVAFHQDYRIATLHIMFIYGFSLMITCIATRVTLGHGGWGHESEKRSKSLLLAGFFLLTAVLLRSIAPLLPEKYFRFLGLASWAWVLAMLIWGVRFVPKQIWLRSNLVEDERYRANAREREKEK